MPILNYTTSIDALKSVSEIESMLIDHGAKSISKDISEDKTISGINFIIDTNYGPLAFCLPVNIDSVYEVLKQQKEAFPRKQIKVSMDQAEKVGLRILKDWTEAQLALIDIDMAKVEQAFLPYMKNKGGITVYELFKEKQLLLE